MSRFSPRVLGLLCSLLCTYSLLAQSAQLPPDVEHIIIREGDGVQPAYGMEACLHTVMLQLDGQVIQSTRSIGVPEYVILGQGSTITSQGRDAAILSMRRGAIHRLTIPKKYFTQSPAIERIPGDRIIIELELLSFGTPLPNGGREVLSLLNAQGPDAGMQWLRTHYGQSNYSFRERELNDVGYTLLNMQRIDDAIEVLQLNAAANPGSFNAHDSLGDAYLAAGNYAMARQHFQQALIINPNFRSAAEKLANIH